MTTTTVASVAVVASIYDAFGRGDVPAILEHLADDVSWDADWADNFAQRTYLEHFTPRRGHAGVVEFFGVIAGYTLHDFQVLDLAASDRQVVAQVIIDLDTPEHLAAATGEDTTKRPA
jgi:ketosteroid isomerase-like protein